MPVPGTLGISFFPSGLELSAQVSLVLGGLRVLVEMAHAQIDVQVLHWQS